MGDDCIFCSIVAGEAPASRVYEDDRVVAFLDLYPVSPGHVLVVPRVHAALLGELDGELRSRVFAVGHRIREAIAGGGLPCDGANFLLNDGRAANQHVPHVHLHVVPRRRGDTFRIAFGFVSRMLGFLGRRRRRRRLDELAARIRRALESDTPTSRPGSRA